MTIDSPSCSRYSTPSIVILPVPSKQVTKASPPDSWVLISSPFAKENRVILNAEFCASVLLTTCVYTSRMIHYKSVAPHFTRLYCSVLCLHHNTPIIKSLFASLNIVFMIISGYVYFLHNTLPSARYYVSVCQLVCPVHMSSVTLRSQYISHYRAIY